MSEAEAPAENIGTYIASLREQLTQAERERDEAVRLLAQARYDFSVTMPFVKGERGSAAQRAWHEGVKALPEPPQEGE